jgi:serine/threonine protein kinase
MHRDLKPENILMILSNNLIKIADFGTAKEIPEFKDGSLTDYVCTRWYRAPECTLKSTNYNEKIDVWAIGCIMAELYTLKPIFPGSDEFDQLNKILKVTGSPTEFNDWPEGFALIQKLNIRMPNFYKSNLKDIIYNANDDAINFLENIFQINPDKRPSCSELLRHPYFTEIQRPVSYNNPVRGIRGNKIQKNFHEFSHFNDNGKNFGNLRGTVKSNYFYDNNTTNTAKFYGYNDKKDIFTSPFDLSKDKPFYSNLTHNMKSNGNENYFGNNQNEISKNSYNYYKNFNFSNYINNNGALPDIDGVFKNNLMNLRNNNAYSKYNQNDENNLINSYNSFHKNKFSSVAKNEILQNTRRDKFFSVNKRNFEDNNTTPIPFPNNNINKKNYISPFTKNRINNNYLSPSSRNIFPNIYNNYGKVY